VIAPRLIIGPTIGEEHDRYVKRVSSSHFHFAGTTANIANHCIRSGS
jgi:hypothetical protein